MPNLSNTPPPTLPQLRGESERLRRELEDVATRADDAARRAAGLVRHSQKQINDLRRLTGNGPDYQRSDAG
jgi:hypothetical protein